MAQNCLVLLQYLFSLIAIFINILHISWFSYYYCLQKLSCYIILHSLLSFVLIFTCTIFLFIIIQRIFLYPSFNVYTYVAYIFKDFVQRSFSLSYIILLLLWFWVSRVTHFPILLIGYHISNEVSVTALEFIYGYCFVY